MPRTAIAVQNIPAFGSGINDVVMSAADAVNDHSFINDGKTFLIMKNTDPAAKTATIVSVADESNRTGDQTVTCAGGGSEICLYGPFKPRDWNQSDGTISLDLTVATGVTFAVVKFT